VRLSSARPLLSLCIPTLDAGEHYQRLVASIAQHTGHVDHEIVTVIGGGVRGYTQPQNEAMAAGAGRFLVAMNDDVQVSAGWIDPLLEQAQAGAWCVTPAEDQNGPVLLFAPHCMLWRAEAWRELGGLDERFVHHGSDIDICRRLHDCGHPPVLVSLPVPVAHQVSATSRPELGPICAADLQRYERKWGASCEEDKHRLAQL
jgi:hypothetical protein